MTRAAEPADWLAVLLDDAEGDEVVTAAVDVAEGLASGDAGSDGWSVLTIAGSGDARWISCGFTARAGVGSRRACT